MPTVRWTDDPRVTDTVLIDFTTTDVDGSPLNPYRVDTVTIYFLERSYATGSLRLVETGDETNPTVSYSMAVPVKTYGSDEMAAWDSLDPGSSEFVRIDTDDEGNPVFGTFRILWQPDLAREGDYYVCWTWAPVVAATKMSEFLRFHLASDIQATTSIPTHATAPGKYEYLLDLYTPQMYKDRISDDDLTPDVLGRMYGAVAKGFAGLEDRINQMVDMLDANTVHESLVPYLSNLFSLKLRSNTPALWRRQAKQALPLFKRKGTLGGLTEAMAQASINLTKVTQYWQVASQFTWTDGFRVTEDGQTEFVLAKVPLAVDLDNFDLAVRFAGESEYTAFTDASVEFDIEDGVTTMTWVDEDTALADGDYVRVLYKTAAVPDQSDEDYLRDLPLMDLRDETEVCYPRKNWNVRLIAESDPMFDVICPQRHPFTQPIVFGKVRTEFPYSENIYNQEEYNGSLRDSLLPCDIDLNFVDSCSYCLSSNVSLDLEVSPLTNDRVAEAKEVATDFLPFHAVVHSYNFSGGIEEYLLPPVEEVAVYITDTPEDTLVTGNMTFNRTIQPDVQNLKRSVLATATAVASGADGVGHHTAASFYYPAQQFDSYTMGLDLTDNMLEILSGTNQGTYSVTNPNRFLIDFTASVPDILDRSAVPFHLSNRLYAGGADIYQDDVFLLTDSTIQFADYEIVTEAEGDASVVVVASGPHAGSYPVVRVVPTGGIEVSGWPTTTTVTGLAYEVQTADSDPIVSGTAGRVTVTRRGRLESGDDLADQYNVRPGDYVDVSGDQYRVIALPDNSTAYLDGWAAGTTVGIPTVTVFRRLIDTGVGYVGPRGMELATTVDHYTALGVSDDLEDDNHQENFMVLIGTAYYQIGEWETTPDGDGNYRIHLTGTPFLDWGASAPTVSYSIVQFAKTSPVTVGTTEITLIDRRGNEVVTSTTETASPMFLNMAGKILNSANQGRPIEFVSQQESLSIEIEWLDGGE